MDFYNEELGAVSRSVNVAKARAAAAAKAKSTTATKNMMTSQQAISSMTSGTNTGIIDVLTYELYDTVTLATGVNVYYPFSLKRGEGGSTYAITNNQDGGQVPAKQRFIISALNISIYSPLPISAAVLAQLNELLFKTSIRMKIDDSPKFETTLSNILGNRTLVQSVDAVGANSLANSSFSGRMVLNRPLVMGAQTIYEVTMENLGLSVPASLNTIQIRFTFERELQRLV